MTVSASFCDAMRRNTASLRTMPLLTKMPEIAFHRSWRRFWHRLRLAQSKQNLAQCTISLKKIKEWAVKTTATVGSFALEAVSANEMELRSVDTFVRTTCKAVMANSAATLQ